MNIPQAAVEQLNKLGVTKDQFRAVVQAAMPHIRKQVAAEIRATDLDSATFNQLARDYSVDYANGYAAGIEASARIAEGEQK